MAYTDGMNRWIKPASYSAPSLFVIMGLFAAVFAWNTFDLARLAMANLQFIGSYGAMALRDGALLQLAEVTLRGVISLGAYLGFKAIEVELVSRWRGD